MLRDVGVKCWSCSRHAETVINEVEHSHTCGGSVVAATASPAAAPADLEAVLWPRRVPRSVSIPHGKQSMKVECQEQVNQAREKQHHPQVVGRS